MQKTGVEWDHIRYWSPELDRILTNPDHRSRSTSGQPAKYPVHRDPYDLSKIFLHSRHANEIIELPAVEKWTNYTQGLTVHQHRLCRQHELIREEQRSDPIALMKAKSAIIEAGRGALRSGTRKKLERNLVRFLYGSRSHPLQAEVVRGSEAVVGTEPMPFSPVMPTPSLIASAQYIVEPKSTVAIANRHVERPNISFDEDDMDEIERLAGEMASGVRTDD